MEYKTKTLKILLYKIIDISSIKIITKYIIIVIIKI